MVVSENYRAIAASLGRAIHESGSWGTGILASIAKYQSFQYRINPQSVILSADFYLKPFKFNDF